MNVLKSSSKALLCCAGFLAAAFLSGCGGGGDQGRGPILGLPAADLVAVTVAPITAAVPIGGVQQFAAMASFNDGSSVDVTKTSAWTSATPAVATVTSAGGLATGVSAGTAAITASFNGKAGTVTMTVSSATLASIAVTPGNPTVAMNSTQQFLAMGTYTDGATRDITAISTFTSATPAVATIVALGGRASSIAAGTSVITATSGLRSGTTTLTVTGASLVSIAVTPPTASAVVGSTQAFLARGTYSDGTNVDISNGVTWTSGSPLVASVATNGLATGLTSGTSIITATSGTKSANATLTVVAVTTLSSIAVTPATPSAQIGGTQAFIARGTFSDGTTLDITNTVAWTSGSVLVASVLPGGVANALTAGTAVITASTGTKSGTATLTVTPALLLTSISIAPAGPSVPVGASQQFSATGTFSDNSTADITNAVVWSSSQVSVATIAQNGQASALAVGVTTIGASQGVKSASATLTVSAAVVASTVNLGSAANFGVLAGTSITNNSGGLTLVTGDVGSPSQTVDPVQTAGFSNYKSGAQLANGLADLQVAITDANSRPCTVNSASGIDLGGLSLPPGVYCYAGSINITGTFTMNAPGLYIFRTASTLNTTANSIVALSGGATADNVFWVPTSPTTLGANSFFKGTMMGQSAAITLGDNADLQKGRVLTAAAATLRNNVIVKP